MGKKLPSGGWERSSVVKKVKKVSILIIHKQKIREKQSVMFIVFVIQRNPDISTGSMPTITDTLSIWLYLIILLILLDLLDL
jgi:hypothetical protein